MNKDFEYILNPNSMAVSPEYDGNGKLCSRVSEVNDSFLIDRTPKQLINDTLNFFASTLEGAIVGSKSILGNYNMIPIVISEALDMYWLPTHSPYIDQCMWFALAHIGDVEPLPNLHSKVVFKNGHTLKAHITKRTLEARVNWTAKLKVIMDERTKVKKSFIYVPDWSRMQVSEQEYRGFYKK